MAEEATLSQGHKAGLRSGRSSLCPRSPPPLLAFPQLCKTHRTGNLHPNHFNVCDSVTFSMSTVLCRHHLPLALGQYVNPRKPVLFSLCTSEGSGQGQGWKAGRPDPQGPMWEPHAFWLPWPKSRTVPTHRCVLSVYFMCVHVCVHLNCLCEYIWLCTHLYACVLGVSL